MWIDVGFFVIVASFFKTMLRRALDAAPQNHLQGLLLVRGQEGDASLEELGIRLQQK